MTHAEALLWMRLKSSALGFKFRRQTSIGVFVVDFYCPSAKLVLELDGSVHETVKARIYDVHRQSLIEGLGLRVLRFTNDEIFVSLDTVLQRIRQNLLLSEEEKARGGANPRVCTHLNPTEPAPYVSVPIEPTLYAPAPTERATECGFAPPRPLLWPPLLWEEGIESHDPSLHQNSKRFTSVIAGSVFDEG